MQNEAQPKVVGNFRSFRLSPRTAQSESVRPRYPRFTESQKSDDGNSGIYIKRVNLGQRAPRIFPLQGSRREVETLPHTNTISKLEGGVQGPPPPGCRLLSGLHLSIKLLLTMAMRE